MSSSQIKWVIGECDKRKIRTCGELKKMNNLMLLPLNGAEDGKQMQMPLSWLLNLFIPGPPPACSFFQVYHFVYQSEYNWVSETDTWEMSLNSASRSLPRGLLIGPPPAIIFNMSISWKYLLVLQLLPHPGLCCRFLSQNCDSFTDYLFN